MKQPVGAPRSAFAKALADKNVSLQCSRIQRSGKPKCEGYIGGFSLLEVMLALFVLSFSLLALANFTTIAWRRNYDANFINWSVALASNRLEASCAKDTGIYDNEWRHNVANVLPHGQGNYAESKNGAKVKVCWWQLFHKHKLCYTVER